MAHDRSLAAQQSRQAVQIFEMVESLDSLRLAKEMEKRCAQAEKNMPVFIEINSGREEKRRESCRIAYGSWRNS